MTTSQIIIFIVLFIFDFWLSIIRPIYKDKSNPDGKGAILSMLRMMMIYGIAVSVTFGLNQEREKSAGKCPEFKEFQGVLYQKK